MVDRSTRIVMGKDQSTYTTPVPNVRRKDTLPSSNVEQFTTIETKGKNGVNALLSAFSMMETPKIAQKREQERPQCNGVTSEKDLTISRKTPSNNTKVLRDISNQNNSSSQTERIEKSVDIDHPNERTLSMKPSGNDSLPMEPTGKDLLPKSHAVRMEKAFAAMNRIHQNPLKLSKEKHTITIEKGIPDRLESNRDLKRQRIDILGLNLLCEATNLLDHDKNQSSENDQMLLSARMVGASSEPPSATAAVSKKNYGCNCPKSNCIKLYCECFANSQFCSTSCKCNKCKNTSSNDGRAGARTLAIQSILARNPHAFREDKSELQKRFTEATTVTCRCVKSRCLKLYCDCFQSSELCNESCLCIKCLNTEAESGDHGERTMARNICLLKRADAFALKRKESGTGCKCKTNR